MRSAVSAYSTRSSSVKTTFASTCVDGLLGRMRDTIARQPSGASVRAALTAPSTHPAVSAKA